MNIRELDKICKWYHLNPYSNANTNIIAEVFKTDIYLQRIPFKSNNHFVSFLEVVISRIIIRDLTTIPLKNTVSFLLMTLHYKVLILVTSENLCEEHL